MLTSEKTQIKKDLKMGNCSKQELITEQRLSSNTNQINVKEEDQGTRIWFPEYNEFCFGDSPNHVNRKLPEQFLEVEWDTLPITYQYQLD